MTKTFITWEQIAQRLFDIDEVGERVYGIPRGGMLAAGFLRRATPVWDPKDATIFLDDIRDSGRTHERWEEKYPGRRWYFLYDKRVPAHAEMGWLVFPWEGDSVGSIEDNVVRILEFIGEDVSREGLVDTPKRVAKAWGELYSGYGKNPADVMKTFADGACDEMVILRDLEIYSTCEHHMMPFIGKAHVAYIPNGKVVGISKLARLVEIYTRRLQIQERIGEQVVAALMEHLQPKGAACVIEAKHFCMCMRGVNKQNSVMVTSALSGVFREGPVRSEFLELVRR